MFALAQAVVPGRAAETTAPLPLPQMAAGCSGAMPDACRAEPACFWVEIYGTAPGAPTAGYCTARISTDALARISAPRLPSLAGPPVEGQSNE